MKQIILPFNTGKPELLEVPSPMVQPGEILIRTTASVVSTGTERMLLEFGKAGYIGKLRQQPEKVKQVLTKLKADGIGPTLRAVKNKLDTPIPLGYSSAGVVIGVGEGVSDIRIGERVACNGAHAEIVSVPRNLVARIPAGVSDESAAFTVLGAIALQSIRLCEPTFGETIVVVGLGLIGQLTVQLLRANGCRVIGTDLNDQRLSLAANQGAETISDISGEAVRAMTNGYGADAVIITASSNDDNIIKSAADMCRKRGRIVLTGVVPLTLSRDYFFRKELSFQVSSSYGPGRYDSTYEEKGLDYPIAYVRWTEGRNFEAVLQAVGRGQLDIGALISSRIPFEDAINAYSKFDDPQHLATLFIYGDSDKTAATSIRLGEPVKARPGGLIGIVGAGNFSSSVLVPALKASGASIGTIISKNGLSATMLAGKSGAGNAGTDFNALLQDDEIAAVVIATPHNSHAELTAKAIRSGRHVFVEKPLALSREELDTITNAMNGSEATVTVGFNRRFAPLAIEAKKLLSSVAGRINGVITVNAGAIPKGHWLQDKTIGGGRLIGEACHFIDLALFFVGSPIVAVCANAAVDGSEQTAEDASILLRFADGAHVVVNYFCNGNKAYDKERIELYRAGTNIIIENWRAIRSYGFRRDVDKRMSQDKGHHGLIKAWIDSLNRHGALPIPPDELLNSSLATIAIEESIAANNWVSL